MAERYMVSVQAAFPVHAISGVNTEALAGKIEAAVRGAVASRPEVIVVDEGASVDVGIVESAEPAKVTEEEPAGIEHGA